MEEQLVFLVSLAGAVVVVIGTLLIVLAAFNKGLMWGLIGLVPVLNVIYVAAHWEEAKPRNGFLMTVVGILALSVALYGGAEREINKQLEQLETTAGVEAPEIKVPVQRPGDVEVPNQAEAEAAGVDLTTSVLDEPEIPERPTGIKPLPPEESVRPRVKEVKYAYQPVSADLLAQFVGEGLRIRTGEGKVLEGKLADLTADSLFLQQSVHSGSANFEYKFADLTGIEVYAPVGQVNAIVTAERLKRERQRAEQAAAEEAQRAAPVPVDAAGDAGAPVTETSPAPASPVTETSPAPVSPVAAPDQPGPSETPPVTEPEPVSPQGVE